MNNLPQKYLTTSIALAMMLFAAGTASAQNSSGGTGTWNGTTWTNGTPDRVDGTQTTTNASGETVQIVGGDVITIDATSSHSSGTLQYAGTNATPTAGAGTGYVDTSSQLNIVDGTITMSGSTQLDVGMAYGGVYLAGAGTVETAAGGGGGTNGDSHLSTSYDGAVDAQYRDVSYWHQNDPVDNQLYIPTDIYAPVHADSADAATTADEMPLYGAGGHLHIGDTGSTTGTFNMDGGVLNVVQYGWGWGADSIDGVSYDAASASSYNGNTDTWTGADPAVQDTTYTSRFEGYLLDDSNGGWDVTAGTTIDNESGTSRMWVDASELDNAYYHNGDANNSNLTNIYTEVGAGNGTFLFPEPPIDATIWSSESRTGPYGDETATAPVGMTDPDGDGVAALVDYYHTIGRTGGNIRVGNTDSSVGVFNITDGLVTTNNIEVGRSGDAAGTVNQTGGDVYTRESMTIGSYNRLDLDLGSDGVYNFGNNAVNGMDATTVFNNSTGNGEDGGSNTLDGDAQYFGRTSTGFEFGDGVGGDTTSSTNYAPGSDGGGVLEITNSLNIGTRGQGVFNLNAAETFTWTDPDTGFTETRDSHMAVGGNINLGVQGGDQDAYSVFNFDSSIDLLAAGRTTNNIIIAMGRNTGNDPQANDSVGIFNYNPTAGQIGSLDANLFQVEGNGTGRNEWDTITVGRGEGATGYFNHNNEKTIFIDSSVIVGDWRESNGTFNLLGQPDATAYNTATGSSLSSANDGQGGLEIDDHLFIGNAGNGVMNQTALTDVKLSDGNDIGDIYIGRYDESSSAGRSNGQAFPIDRDNAYGEYNFGLPDAGDNMVHSGSDVVGASRADAGSNNLGTINTPTISEVRELRIGDQGEGVFNYYADTASLNIDQNIDLGSQRTGTGVFNVVSDAGVTVTSGTATTGANRDINVGESGSGIFNQGTFSADNTGTTADGTTGQNSTVATSGGDMIVGGARSYVTQRSILLAEVTDSGEGTYNLNGNGAAIDLGGGLLSAEGHGSGGKIEIGTGDNVQEGIMFYDQASNGLNLADTSDVNVVVGQDGEGNDIIETRTVVRDARNPWGNTLDDHSTGAWLAQSGEDVATQQQLGTGTLFGTADTFGTDSAVTDLNGDAVTLNKFAGAEDGQGSLGEFNHNNDTNLFLNQADITIADGDNSQGLFNQNGTGDVKMLGSLEMSVDRFDTGNASLAAPNAAALAAATNGSDATQFEMGQSTYSVNNADAVLDLNAQDVIGDSVDASGRGTEVNDTYAGGGPTKGNLQARTNEAQINLLDGAINNSRNIKADVVQYGGSFDMDAAGVAGFVTTDLREGNHDFIQQEVGASFTSSITGLSTTSSIAPTIAFDTNNFDGLLDLDSNISASTAKNSGTVNSDTLAADFIRLNGATGSIDLDFSTLLTGSDYTGAANGQYWNLLDWNSGFDWSPDAGGRGQAAFDFGLGAGILPTLGLDPGTGEQLVWSIDESALSMPDLWSSHGIIYIALDISYVPEPSSTALLGLGALTLAFRRRRI